MFVFAWLAGGDEEADLRLLARLLSPARYRIDALPCVRSTATFDPSHRSLEALGVRVDRVAHDLSFDDTVRYLARALAGYEIVVSCQDVADVYPALERLSHRPPLIEHGRTPAEALAGPKHFTARYVATSETIRAAAASRMSDRPRHARVIASAADSSPFDLSPFDRADEDREIARQWETLFEEVLDETPAPPPRLFRSFAQGGFEASTHRLRTGRRLDVIAATGHDAHAERDYRQLAAMGVQTIRDAARWHLIEREPRRYDFSSFLPMADAARRAGVQVIWDLLHYGWPDDVDIWSPAFVDRFAAFARATARVWRETTDEVPFWCPVNEISFFAWGGGDVGYLNPFGVGRGVELKVQLVRAAIGAIHALRDVDPRARIVHCEPLIAIHHNPANDRPRSEAEGLHQGQFQAFDMLMGRSWPQLGGEPALLDIVGVNYYPRNQWLHLGPTIDVDHPTYRPLSDLLFETYARYGRPIFVSETGVEDERRASWLRYVAGEAGRARRRGVPVEGVCLYPVLNHPGWDDDRDCQNGLLTQGFEGLRRGVDAALAEAVTALVQEYAAPPSGGTSVRDRRRARPRRRLPKAFGRSAQLL